MDFIIRLSAVSDLLDGYKVIHTNIPSCSEVDTNTDLSLCNVPTNNWTSDQAPVADR